jgi:hypothetical protein
MKHHVAKDDYEKTVLAYGNSIYEMKCNDRGRSAAFCASREFKGQFAKTTCNTF